MKQIPHMFLLAVLLSTIVTAPLLAQQADPSSSTGIEADRSNKGIRAVTGITVDKIAGFESGQKTEAAHSDNKEIGELQIDHGSSTNQSGQGGGGFISYTSKAGSNEIHGSFQHYFNNEMLNARGFFGNKSRERNNRLGAEISVPIIKNKSYLYYSFGMVWVRSGSMPSYSNSTPVDAFKQGDFEQLLTGNMMSRDILGRAIYEGQIFDPSSTRTIGRVPVRDSFPNNIIPASHPMRSYVAAGIIPLMVQPDIQGLERNVQGNSAIDQTWMANSPAHLVRLDHSFSEKFRTTHTYYSTYGPTIRNCGGVDGCRSSHNPELLPQMNANYYGEGLIQRAFTHRATQKFDWIISRNLLNHSTIRYDQFRIKGHSLSAGVGWPEKLWGSGGNGLLESDASPPAIDFTGNNHYSPLGNTWGRSGYILDHQIQFSNDLIWIRNRHTIKIGGEYRHYIYPFRGWANNVAGMFNFHRRHTGGFDADGNNLVTTGDPFASFILGQVNSTMFQIPDFPTINEDYMALYVTDEFRMTSRLSVTLGVRFDYQTAIREKNNNMSTFDPRMPNPGAGGLPGAMIFAGTGKGRTGRETLENPPVDAIGPRLGFAYRMGEKYVVRGAYGIYYSNVPHDQLSGLNTLGFRSNPTAVDTSNGRQSVYMLDAGFPQENIVLPPFIDPTIANGTSPVSITSDRVTLPRIQNWSFTIQRELTDHITLDIGYTGNRGSRLIADRQVLGTAINMNNPSILGNGASVLSAPAESRIVQAAGIQVPYEGFSGSTAQALRQFPQMQTIDYKNVPVGNSFYHAFEAQVNKRFSEGTQFHVDYTWSKLTGLGAERNFFRSDYAQGPQNPVDTHSLERGLSAEDVPHALMTAFTYAIPMFKQKKFGLAAKLFGGWAITGIIRVESGRPLNIVMANDLDAFLFNGQKRPDVLSDKVRINYGGRFDVASDRFLDHSAFTDPGPLRFGNASRTMNYVRGFSNVAENLSLSKDTWVNQKFKLKFETQFGNFLNRVVFCDPIRNYSASSFGRTTGQCNAPRFVQVGFRLDL